MHHSVTSSAVTRCNISNEGCALEDNEVQGSRQRKRSAARVLVWIINRVTKSLQIWLGLPTSPLALAYTLAILLLLFVLTLIGKCMQYFYLV